MDRNILCNNLRILCIVQNNGFLDTKTNGKAENIKLARHVKFQISPSTAQRTDAR